MQVYNQKQLVESLMLLIEKHQSKEGKLNLTPHFQQALENTLHFNHARQIASETKNVSILLSDLRGFTTLSEKHSPLLLVELLNYYFSKMSFIIDRYGGVIDKFMGDSIMVVFGTLEHKINDLQNTLSCAVEMQIAMNDINLQSQALGLPDLYMGIGINSGEVVAGTLGSDIYREYTVIGDEVNIVSRVEAQSLRGQILLTENSYQQAKDYIQIGNINEVFVKGKSKPIKMYELTAIYQPQLLQVPLREVRKSPRVLTHIPLTYQRLLGKRVSNTKHGGTIIDLSYGGLYAKTYDPLQPNAEVKILVSLSLLADEKSQIYARVINCTYRDNSYETHFEFTSIDERARIVIKTYVDQLLT